MDEYSHFVHKERLRSRNCIDYGVFPMVAGVGFEPHGLRVMRASNDVGFKIHRLAKTYTRKAEPTQKPTNVGEEGSGI